MPVREMKESDLPEVLAIQQELAFQDWKEPQFVSEIKAGYALAVVYESDTEPAEILGYAIFHLMGPDSELLSIATKRNAQKILALVDEGGDSVFLEVRENNANARHFYERHGFEPYSVRKNYYSDGETAILYKKNL